MATLQLSDGRSDGALLGQSVSDKVGFFGITPAIQQSGAAQAAVTTTAPAITQFGYSQAQATAILNLLNEIRRVLVLHGLMKGSS